MTQEVQKTRLVSIGPGILSIAKVDRQGYITRTFNGALTSDPSDAREDPDKLNMSPPA